MMKEKFLRAFNSALYFLGGVMKDTSECTKCKYGKLVKTKEKPHYYIQCKQKDKQYAYGQRLECIDYERR